ncbi:MAG: hypothetical protein JSV59_04025 [Flavobacteriaceae bacterium]|nr:MAG: hypothetical protein JSV59_04025 [Flavobacteriaceae bacterium]
MLKKYLVSLFCIVLLTLACKQKRNSTQADDPKNPLDTIKDISELTYPEIFYLLHNEEEYGMDVHGDLFGQEAIADVELFVSSKSECGDALSLTSSHSSQNIKAAVRTSFNFPGNPANEMFRAYIVKPEEIVPVGHTRLCYKNREYEINREVVSAGFTDEE